MGLIVNPKRSGTHRPVFDGTQSARAHPYPDPEDPRGRVGTGDVHESVVTDYPKGEVSDRSTRLRRTLDTNSMEVSDALGRTVRRAGLTGRRRGTTLLRRLLLC